MPVGFPWLIASRANVPLSLPDHEAVWLVGGALTFFEGPLVMSEQNTPDTSPSLGVLVQEFGGTREAFRPSIANLIAGVIIGLLLIGGGLAFISGFLYLYLRPEGNDLQTTLFGLAVGIVLIASGILFIYVMKRMFSYRLVVCTRGFIRQVGRDTDCCQWEDIASVTEEVKTDHLPLQGVAKYAAPVGKSRSYTIRRKDGEEFLFDLDTIKRLGRFGKMVREEAEKRGIPWIVES
jgi:hypothetical protein